MGKIAESRNLQAGYEKKASAALGGPLKGRRLEQ